MDYSGDFGNSFTSRGSPEAVIQELWSEVANAPRLRAFPHLVGRARVVGGEIKELEADVVFMKRLREEILPEEGNWVEFLIPIEVSGGPERLLEKLRTLLVG